MRSSRSPSLHRRLVCAAAAGLLAMPTALTAQATAPTPSFEDVLSLRSVTGPVISPDGKSVVFGVRTTNWNENRYDTALWLVRDGTAPVQLTEPERGLGGGIQWSPDGRWIAFAADRGSGAQVYVLRAAGGEAQQVTDAPKGVSAFHWAPDGRRIAYTAMDPDSALMRRKARYGDFTIHDEDVSRAALWVIDVPHDSEPATTSVICPPRTTKTDSLARTAHRCTPLPTPTKLAGDSTFTVANFDWSPDGTRIAFERRGNAHIVFTSTADIDVVDVTTGTLHALVTTPGRDGAPVWSPDSRWILYSSAGGDTTSNYYTNGQFLKIPADGGTPVQLAANFDEQVGDYRWTPAGIFMLAYHGTQRNVYRVDANSGDVTQITHEPQYIMDADFSANGTRYALLGQTSSTLPEIYLGDVGAGNLSPVTHMSTQVASWPIGTSEVISWKSKDGTRIEGVLHKPRDFDPHRKYPLFVVIHGGPTGIDVPGVPTTSSYPILQWVAEGALVLRPNYRGSAGYGAKFRALNVRNLGAGDEWDVLSGVDHLVAQGIVDTTRMGAMGWSQGGYISAYLTTTTTRFRAISVGAGISDWMTYYVGTDIHPFTRQYLKATPWDDPAIYAKTSPITFIKKARTPTLIQHGEKDQRVPISNAYELLQGLHDQGVPARLVVYNGFGHGVTRPKERLAVLWHNWQWFGKYVWGEHIEIPQ